jgi:DnaJ-class molecular chaperone
MTKMINCPECGGEGRCEYEYARPGSFDNPEGSYEAYWADCENCGGRGEIEDWESEEGTNDAVMQEMMDGWKWDNN